MSKSSNKIQVFELVGTSSVDYSWIWKVFLEQKKNGTFTLSCVQEYSSGHDQTTVNPFKSITDGESLLDAVNVAWSAMIDNEIDQFDLKTLVSAVRKTFPVLGEQFQTAVDEYNDIFGLGTAE